MCLGAVRASYFYYVPTTTTRATKYNRADERKLTLMTLKSVANEFFFSRQNVSLHFSLSFFGWLAVERATAFFPLSLSHLIHHIE
jgi:hypothetical protein